MRAEGQANIDRIEAALALVRQSLDWDHALRQLDELDARVQDPTLWDDPKQAQAITQEQKRLETAINTVREIESEMADAIEFVDDSSPGTRRPYVAQGTQVLADDAIEYVDDEDEDQTAQSDRFRTVIHGRTKSRDPERARALEERLDRMTGDK